MARIYENPNARAFGALVHHISKSVSLIIRNSKSRDFRVSIVFGPNAYIEVDVILEVFAMRRNFERRLLGVSIIRLLDARSTAAKTCNPSRDDFNATGSKI